MIYKRWFAPLQDLDEAGSPVTAEMAAGGHP
jgi:hypothetical protein